MSYWPQITCPVLPYAANSVFLHLYLKPTILSPDLFFRNCLDHCLPLWPDGVNYGNAVVTSSKRVSKRVPYYCLNVTTLHSGICCRISVCRRRLSVIYNVRVPYSAGWNFWQFWINSWQLVMSLTWQARRHCQRWQRIHVEHRLHSVQKGSSLLCLLHPPLIHRP